MSPTSHLRSQIFYHLDSELPETANFLAGRLHALEPRSPESHHLLALTYLRLHRFRAAYDYSSKYGSNGRHLGCAYIFAQACLQLGGARVIEGANALEKCKTLWVGKSHFGRCSDTQRVAIPDSAACLTLQGRLWKAHGDAKKAGDCFIEAHKHNPFVWEAFDGLCKVGADLKVERMFQPSVESLGADTRMEVETKESRAMEDPFVQEKTAPLSTQPNFNPQVFTPGADPFSTVSRVVGEPGSETRAHGAKGKDIAAVQKNWKSEISEWDTPTADPITLEDDVAMGGVMLENREGFVPAAPQRRPRAAQILESVDRPQPSGLGNPSSETLDESAQQQAHQRKPSVGGHKRTLFGHAPLPSNAVSTSDSAAISQPPRRSNRLFGQGSGIRSTRSTAMDSTASSIAGRVSTADRPAKAATGTKGRMGSTVGRVVSGNRKMLPPDRNDKETKRAPSRNSERNVPTSVASTAASAPQHPRAAALGSQSQLKDTTTPQIDQEGLVAVLDHLRDLATGVYSTTRFDTSLAIRTFRSLSATQRETPFVSAQLGKAYYEAADYKSAEHCFARVLKLQPSRMEDMDVYSTVLWHLKRETALTFLCHHLGETDYVAPERWVAVGNAFSLSREHDQAIAAFKRATQVDGRFAYAWTLMGHEYIANEEFDAALSCFRKAISIERRGYGGWYGLGKAFERMGKLEESERHYRIAASINPGNSTLLVCIGVVLERLRNKKAALANYSRALELTPQSALARFKKARVLMHLRYWSEALVELEILRDQAPDEANVWFLLGKCYKGLGERGEALRALTTALNLDAKAAPFIKEAMEALDEDAEIESGDD